MIMQTREHDLKWWLQLVPTLNWRGASTYEKTAPHRYIVRDKDLDSADFDRAVRVIRTFGQPGKFHATTQIYLVNGETKWWTMRGTVAEQGVINMAPASEVYGVQDAPLTATGHFTVYDRIATEYDGLRTSLADLAENEQVRRLIAGHFGAYAPSTLDVGCGTGLLLDLGVVSPMNYTGIDPSQGMLNQLVVKHPRAKDLMPGTAAETLIKFADGRHFDLVCALFGAASYMTPKDWRRMLTLSDNLTIFMVLEPGYLPAYWEGSERVAMMYQAHLAHRAMEDLTFALPTRTHRLRGIHKIGHSHAVLVTR